MAADTLLVVDHLYLARRVLLDELEKQGVTRSLSVAWRSLEGLENVDPACVVAILQMDHTLDAAGMGRYKCLKFVSLLMTGVDQFDETYATKEKIASKNVSNYATQAVAEMNLLLAIGALRCVPRAIDDLRKGRFDRDCGPGRELAGLRVGILGMGTIGTRTAELLRPFGCAIAGWSMTRSIPLESGVTSVSIPELLANSDVLIVQARLVRGPKELGGNEGMLGTKELAALPDGAVLVNAARAGLVDRGALLAELRSGRISAGLDVQFDERIGVVDELFTMPNVFALPHLGFKAHDALAKLARLGVRNVAEWLAARRS